MPLCIGTPLSRGVLMAAPLRRLVSRTVNRPGVIAIREEGGKACLCHLRDPGLSVRLGSLWGFARASGPCNRGHTCVLLRDTYQRFITSPNIRGSRYYIYIHKKIPFKSRRYFSLCISCPRGRESDKWRSNNAPSLSRSLSLSLCMSFEWFRNKPKSDFRKLTRSSSYKGIPRCSRISRGSHIDSIIASTCVYVKCVINNLIYLRYLLTFIV